MRSIDLNADCGEGYGRWSLGDDESLLPLVSSANLACGFHAGDPGMIKRSVALCVANNVAIGAQPSVPDLQGFGRREMHISADEVHAMVLYQVGAVGAFCRAVKAPLRHVKPHGALYNMAARDIALARAVASAVSDFDADLALFGPPGSALESAAASAGLRFVREAFVDRRYRSDGSLMPRSEPGAVIDDEDAAIAQAISIIEQATVTTGNGETVAVSADTLCLHGDHMHAADFAHRLRKALAERSINIKAPTT